MVGNIRSATNSQEAEREKSVSRDTGISREGRNKFAPNKEKLVKEVK